MIKAYCHQPISAKDALTLTEKLFSVFHSWPCHFKWRICWMVNHFRLYANQSIHDAPLKIYQIHDMVWSVWHEFRLCIFELSIRRQAQQAHNTDEHHRCQQCTGDRTCIIWSLFDIMCYFFIIFIIVYVVCCISYGNFIAIQCSIHIAMKKKKKKKKRTNIHYSTLLTVLSGLNAKNGKWENCWC